MLDDQCLRSHGQDFLCGSRQVGFCSQHFGFTIVDHQNVDQAQCLAKLRVGAADPIIHGIAAGQFDAGEPAAHCGLQTGIDIGQEQKIGIFVLRRDTRLEVLKDVQVREVGLGFVEII